MNIKTPLQSIAANIDIALKTSMKHTIRFLKWCGTFLFYFAFSMSVSGADFNPNTTTSQKFLTIHYNNGSSSLATRQYSKKSTDFQLSGTGLTGQVLDGGDHWILDITGGNLNGCISSQCGVEIRLNANSIVLSHTRGSYTAISGDGGVKIVGPGTLHVDNFTESPSIKSTLSGKSLTSIVQGACVSINCLQEAAGIVAYGGIRVNASSLHVNSLATGIYSSGPVSISGSIVTVIAAGDAFRVDGRNPLDIAYSCVHLGGGTAEYGWYGANGLNINGGNISVSSSVFCASGGMCGVGGKKGIVPAYFTASFDNVIGVIAGGNNGILDANDISISGGATKLSIIGNAEGAVDASDEYYTRGQSVVCRYTGQSVWDRTRFQLCGGRVDLYAPGNCALACGTNIVSAGKLNVRSDPKFGDFRTLYTVSGAVLAAEAVAGSLAFKSDILFTDHLLAQVLESSWTAGEVALTVDKAKAMTGICANEMIVSGGQVNIEASNVGIHLGGTSHYDNGSFLCMNGGIMSVVSDGAAILDRGEWWYVGYDYHKDDNSKIWISGGRLSAKGGQNGILTCGGIWMEGGTLEAAATGGYSAGTTSEKPGIIGYALSANNGLYINGGSFLTTSGALRTTPCTYSDHDFAAVYPCDLAVSGVNSDGAVSIVDVVPSWYGMDDLYPINGILRFWLPVGASSLKMGETVYKANDDGMVVAGDNVFKAEETAGNTLTSIAINGASSVASGDSVTYTCTATYSDGSTAAVSPKWSLSPESSYGNINVVGIFTANTTTVERSVTIMAAFGGRTITKTIAVVPSEQATFIVTLDGQGGSGGTESITATYGVAMPVITVPTRAGYAFEGYYTKPNGRGTQYYTAEGVSSRNWDITAATTLFAHWGSFVLHVDAATGDDRNDGLSWATAKASIQAAIDAADEGGRILVNDGIYEPISTVPYEYRDGEWGYFTKKLEIVSVNGAASTIIDGSLTWARGVTNRIAYLGRNGNRETVLDGFTLRKGRPSGGIYYPGAGAYGGTLRRCVLTDNDSGEAAGGGAANATLESCTVSGNRTEYNGGGAWNCSLTDCIVEGNEAAGIGGGTCVCQLKRCVVRNNTAGGNGGGGIAGAAEDCLFVGNSSGAAGGGLAECGKVDRCTITENRAVVGGGVCQSVIHSCIVWNNDAGGNSDNVELTDGFFSDTAPVLGGIGNICSDPCFRNATTGDYGLATASPCIDAGFGPTDMKLIDLAGSMRWQGVRIDMGAYESANSETPLFLPEEIWVDAANGNDARSGSTRTEALATLDAAVQKAADGSTIRVLPGTYEPFTMEGRTLRVVSEDGAAHTVIDGRGLSRCVWIGFDSSSEISGFTIRNGNTQIDGGGAMGGTLADCVLENNTSPFGGAAAHSTLLRCRIENNSSTETGGGCENCYLFNCLVVGNSSKLDGGGLYNSCAVNCTIVENNSLSGVGGGISYTIATNCIVWGNIATSNFDIYSCDEWRLCSPVVNPECGSITNNPMFVNAAAGDFRLLPDSPCVDAGVDVDGIGGTDMDGNPRRIGQSVDIGCYENLNLEITLDPLGGSGDFASVTATYGTAMPTITPPTRSGYAFAGYYSEPNGEGTQYYNADCTSARAWDLTTVTTLYAKWTACTYVIAFSANGGTGTMARQTATRDANVTLSANKFTRPGYSFAGWATSASGAVAYKDKASVKNLAAAGKTVTLYAKWKPTTYKVFFSANGGKGTMAAQAITYGKATKLTKNVFMRSGYIFIGWAKKKGGAVAYTNAQGVKNLTAAGKTITLYAVWAKAKYKVAFYANGGKGKIVVQTMIYGKAAKLAANKFTRKGFVFKGWAKSAALAKKGKVNYKNKQSVKDLVKDGKTVKLYAVWKPSNINVAANASGSSLKFKTGGNAKWTVDSESVNGTWSAKSGKIADTQKTWLQTTVVGPGTLTFRCKVSCESAPQTSSGWYDYLDCLVDNKSELRADSVVIASPTSTWSASLGAWYFLYIKISSSGKHTVKWVYCKDQSSSDGYDCAWIDEVVWKPAR